MPASPVESAWRALLGEIMFSAQTSKALVLAGGILVLTGSAAWAVTNVSGTIQGTINVNFATAPASGTQITCTLILIGSDTLAPTESNSVTVTVGGTTASCSVPVRYKWRVQNPNSNMAISYSVSGPTRTSSGIFDVIQMPANGTKTNVTIGVAQ